MTRIRQYRALRPCPTFAFQEFAQCLRGSHKWRIFVINANYPQKVADGRISKTHANKPSLLGDAPINNGNKNLESLGFFPLDDTFNKNLFESVTFKSLLDRLQFPPLFINHSSYYNSVCAEAVTLNRLGRRKLSFSW